MSLINEALKKAQASQGRPGPLLPLQGAPQPVPGAPPRRHRYLFGFLAALLLVGVFSAAMTSFFVWQLLGPKDRQPETGFRPPVGVAAPGAADAQPALESPLPAEPAEPAPAETAPAEPAALAAAAAAVQLAEPEQLSGLVAVAGPADSPAPETAKRLGELEIRGILGVSRVLLHDLASGRSRAYRVGDSVEGYPELIVASITDSSVTFKDHDGFIHTKPF